MRNQTLKLSGQPGQTASFDRRTGLYELLGELAKGMRVQSLAFHCVVGAGIGKMNNPTARRYGWQFVIRGRLTCNPAEITTFRCWRDGRVPKYQELTTISVVDVTF